jgi:tetratricopeptide (TPR) repeat protein
VVISAVSGMGGIGKSELALQYAYRHQTATYPSGICWLKAREDLGLQIVEFASLCKYPTPPSDWDLVKRVRWYWQQWRNEATLIVFDDVQRYGDIQPFLPPPQSQFRVLLTSRSKFPAPVQDCEIKVLSEARSIELLGSFDPEVKLRIDADLATTQKICHWLGYLPLGLELVGRYLANDRDLTIEEVWQNLNSEKLMAQALLAAEAGMTADLGVIAAFELSWQKLTPEAQELAARLSLFALAEIPWMLVEQCLSAWEPGQQKKQRKSLVGASLLTRSRQGMYELHQLLREFFALKLAAMPERVTFTTEFAQVLTEIAKIVPKTVTIEQQSRLKEFIPHLAVATGFSEYLSDNDKIFCCEGLARFYRAQSQFSTVEFWYQKSLAISEKELGANHPSTATVLNNLAGLYKSIGRYAEAELLYVRSLAINEKELGANHPDTAAILNNLAELYRSLGRYAEAEPLFVRSLAIKEEELGANHPDTASSLNNLALLYESLGRYAEAELRFVRSLAINEKKLGANHPSTANSLNCLAALYRSLGRYAEAELLFVRSLVIREKELGANHPDTASSLNSLAELYRLIPRYPEAEPLYVRSLAIREKELGANHPDTASSLNNLATLYYSLGRDIEAEPLYVRALEILEDKLGTDHQKTQTTRNNLQILRQQ